MSGLREQIERLAKMRLGLNDGQALQRDLQVLSEAATELHGSVSKFATQLSANRAAALPIDQIDGVASLRASATALHTAVLGDEAALKRDALVALKGRVDHAVASLKDDAQAQWARRVADTCSPAVEGLLEACAELRLPGANELTSLVPRLKNAISPTKEHWQRLAEFGQKVEEFIATTTNNDPRIGDLLNRLVDPGLTVAEASDPSFRAWLSEKGLDARLRVTIR